MLIKCHFSLYPLRQTTISQSIERVIDEVRRAGLNPQVGPTNTYIEGPMDVVFKALQNAYLQAIEQGDAVLSVTMSNESSDLPLEKRLNPSAEVSADSAAEVFSS